MQALTAIVAMGYRCTSRLSLFVRKSPAVGRDYSSKRQPPGTGADDHWAKFPSSDQR